MKKIIFAVAMAALLLLANQSFAACPITYENKGMIQVITFTCGTDAAGNATFANVTTKPLFGYVFMAETNPGTTAPTNAYDIVLNDADGADVMGGNLLNRDGAAPGGSTTQRAAPAVVGFVDGTLTLVVTNNSVNNATFVLKVWLYREQ